MRGVGLIAAAFCLPAAAQLSVTTYQYGNSRTGWNPNETVLTPANVNSAQFGRLGSWNVDGYVYGQPLYLSSVYVPQVGVRNVVYVATEHDSVYAFDADSPGAAPLWQRSFLSAGITTVPYTDVGCDQIVPEIGITSTPVIDAATGTLYVVAMTKESGTYAHRLYALDAVSGAERPGSPVPVQASFPQSGGGTVTFVAKNYKQRPGLLLLNGVVYTAWSSHCDIGSYHGWLIGYDAATLRQVSVYVNTPNGNEGSFWAGGAAPAADAAGNIYVVAGNGTFDYAAGGADLGESYIKLSSSPQLAVADYFTPFNYQTLNDNDVDTGSAGVVLLPDEAGGGGHAHLMTGAGKEGRIYLLDRDRMGGFQSGSDSQIVQSIPGAIGGLFGNPAYFNGTVYFCGANDYFKAFALSGGRLSTKPSSTAPAPFDYPGCVPVISSNGNAGGIVWALDPAAVLHAYDASNLATELYNSNQNRGRDALGSYVKFTAPLVVNGKVFAGTQNALVEYGLVGTSKGIVVTAENAAGGATRYAAPGSLISIFGTGLAQSTGSAQGFPLPGTLGGATVTIGGLAVPLLYASDGQINAQIPFEVAAGPAALLVTAGSRAVAETTINTQATAPGLFAIAPGRAAALNQDNSVNGPSQPVAPGSVVQLFLTGLGAVDRAVATGAAAPITPLSQATAGVTVYIGGIAAQVFFAGLAPGYAGLYQVNAVVPAGLTGDVPVEVVAGGVPSNIASISVR